jgi:WD40 repeat protein
VAALAFSPDGRVLVSSPEAGLGRVWDISTPGQPRGPGLLFDRRAAISSLAFRPDGAVLAAGSGGKGTNFEVTLWNVTDPVTPRREGVPLLGHDDPVVGLSFSADGETLWSVNRNVSLIRWNVTVPAQARQTAHALPERSDYQDIVAFRSDQRAIASSGPEGVIVRDISDPDNVVLLDMTLRDHYARTMLFSPDGKTLFTGGDDVLVWDMSSAWQPRRYGTALGTGNGVRSLAISTDGETLAVGSEKEVTLWNVEDPAHPFRLGPPLTVEKGPIDVVALNRDGHLLATGSNSGEVLLWDLSRVRHVRDHLTDEACARARRGLNEDEWIRQVGANLAFRKSCG